jgi:outer membrane protein
MIVKFFMKRLFILCLASMLGFGISQAQEIWTLQKCIDKALENNLTIKKGQLVIASNQLTSQSNKEALLPSLSGFAGYNFSFGRNINPVNNTYVEQNVQSGQFGLSSSVTLFNGLQNINTIKLGKINEEVSRKDLEVIYNTVSLQVATQFLQILFNQETINTVKSTVSSTEKQLETANVLFASGNTNQSNVLELEAKLASDKLDLVMPKIIIAFHY